MIKEQSIMNTLIQLIVILAIFSIAVISAIKKDKLEKPEKSGKPLEHEEDGQLDEWFDEAGPISYEEEKARGERVPLKQVHISNKKVNVGLKEGVSTIYGEHIKVDEEEFEVEPIVDVSSQEEIRKGIIWSEILQRKYF